MEDRHTVSRFGLALAVLAILACGRAPVPETSHAGHEPAAISSAPEESIPATEPAAALAHIWPPIKGERYPEIELLDVNGARVNLNSLAGKLLLIEPIGISCPACQAFAGGNDLGPFREVQPQRGVSSIERGLREAAGIDLAQRPDIVYVQLLLYDMSARQSPSLADAKAWRDHFRLNDRDNIVILVGDARYINQASYNMVPGLQLVDRNFVLRADATGHHPQDGLYSTLMPLLKQLASKNPGSS